MLRFEPDRMESSLGRINELQRVAFAACCAQRLRCVISTISKCVSNNQYVTAFDTALDLLWERVVSGTEDNEDNCDLILVTMYRLIDNLEKVGEDSLTPYVDDAMSSAAYGIRCLKSGESQEAIWAAQRAYDSADEFAMREIENLSNDIGKEDRILDHPVVQTELARQQRDLAELQSHDVLDIERIETLRHRSLIEKTIPLLPGSGPIL